MTVALDGLPTVSRSVVGWRPATLKSLPVSSSQPTGTASNSGASGAGRPPASISAPSGREAVQSLHPHGGCSRMADPVAGLQDITEFLAPARSCSGAKGAWDDRQRTCESRRHTRIGSARGMHPWTAGHSGEGTRWPRQATHKPPCRNMRWGRTASSLGHNERAPSPGSRSFRSAAPSDIPVPASDSLDWPSLDREPSHPRREHMSCPRRTHCSCSREHNSPR